MATETPDPTSLDPWLQEYGQKTMTSHHSLMSTSPTPNKQMRGTSNCKYGITIVDGVINHVLLIQADSGVSVDYVILFLFVSVGAAVADDAFLSTDGAVAAAAAAAGP